MKTQPNTSPTETKDSDLIVLGVASADTKGPGGVLEFMGRTTVPGISED